MCVPRLVSGREPRKICFWITSSLRLYLLLCCAPALEMFSSSTKLCVALAVPLTLVVFVCDDK